MMLKNTLNFAIVLGLIKYNSYLIESGWLDIMFTICVAGIFFFISLLFFEKFFYIFGCLLVVCLAYNIIFIQLGDYGVVGDGGSGGNAIINECVEKDFTLFDVKCLEKLSTPMESLPIDCVVKMNSKLCASVALVINIINFKEPENFDDKKVLSFKKYTKSLSTLLKHYGLTNLVTDKQIQEMVESKYINEHDCVKNTIECFGYGSEETDQIVRLSWINKIWNGNVFKKVDEEESLYVRILGSGIGRACIRIQDFLVYYSYT